MKNDALSVIAEKIKAAESVWLFPHVNPDGDALGSCAALCRGLRLMGKEAFVLVDEELPANLRFLDNGYCTADCEKLPEPDICICVDCSSEDRFEKRAKAFYRGRLRICLDHHPARESAWDYNYIDPKEAATGQIIYALLDELGVGPDREIGEAIFAAITTDTGNFQYSNTQAKSHLIAAELYEWGVDCNKVSVAIYENVRLEKMMMQTKAMEGLKLIAGGRGALVSVSQEILRETGAFMDEAEGLSKELRSIAGVEYAAVIKEYEREKIKVSLRAKSRGNVARIAEKLGGGGHVKAAGCTIKKPLKEAEKLVEREMLAAIRELDEQ